MEQAAVELEAMGYVLQQKIKHHDIYRKAPGIVVEAHRAMYDRTVDERQYAYFSDLSRAVRRKGFLYVYDFEAEDFYIYMMAHMAKHFYKRGCGIRNLVDIYVFLEKFGGEMNADYLQKQFAGLGLTAFTEHMEKLAELFEVPLEDLLDDYNLFLLRGQGEQIKAIRQRLGLTQKVYAAQLGVPLQKFKRWEQGNVQIFKSTWEKYFKQGLESRE